MQDAALAETFWRSLRYFNFYRLTVGILLLVFLVLPAGWGLFEPIDRQLFLAAASASVVLALASLILLQQLRRRFNLQLSFQVAADIAVYIVLMHASGGVRSGVGIMLLVSLAGAGLVGQGRLVLFYAAVASIALLLLEVYRGLQAGDLDPAAIFQSGWLCVGFFATAVSARLLARRVVANEELARRRGRDLDRQIKVSERAIAQLEDGVLVVGEGGEVLQTNPRARDYLGFAAAAASGGRPAARLELLLPSLARALAQWRRGESADVCEFRSPLGGRQLLARFVTLGSESPDTLIFVEDIGKQREQAQQLKLAALGRLTANIAHEIRNPLSAILHSTELLQEGEHDAVDARLLRIVIDNTRRLERIVSDVLEVGRRDRAHREAIDLAVYLPNLLEEFMTGTRLARDIVDCRIEGRVVLEFDRAHLHQVLSNLLENALRHGRQLPGSLRIRVGNEQGVVHLHVSDDGDGVPPQLRAQVFEPFFTTHEQGTGLGLYIARELCDANGARLELMENAPGAHFCLIGG